jgi:glutaminyl-peptide cyclotransferase
MAFRRTIAPALALVAAVGFARCGGAAPSFSGDSAYVSLEDQCAIGPRYPGSAGHLAVQRYIAAKLRQCGASVSAQPFDAVTSDGDTLHLVNLIGNYRRHERVRVLIGAHYDTRPRADRDPDAANRETPILGANDGASGVAVLLEIARLLGESEPPVGVDLVFFDGEDWGAEGNVDDYLLGSKHFATHLRGYRPRAVIVVDMVGERGAVFTVEGFSRASAPELCDDIVSVAAKLGVSAFERAPGPSIIDDHVPFIRAGLAAIDIIDFDYPYWHTLGDRPDKCSAESLRAVGAVLVGYLWGAPR